MASAYDELMKSMKDYRDSGAADRDAEKERKRREELKRQERERDEEERRRSKDPSKDRIDHGLKKYGPGSYREMMAPGNTGGRG